MDYKIKGEFYGGVLWMFIHRKSTTEIWNNNTL
jgi:hypothetical protein